MSNFLNLDLNIKNLTPIIRELIREQLKQKENEEKQRIKQEQVLIQDTKEKPLTDSEIRQLRSMIKDFKLEMMERHTPNIKFRR